MQTFHIFKLYPSFEKYRYKPSGTFSVTHQSSHFSETGFIALFREELWSSVGISFVENAFRAFPKNRFKEEMEQGHVHKFDHKSWIMATNAVSVTVVVVIVVAVVIFAYAVAFVASVVLIEI